MTDKERYNATLFPEPSFINSLPAEFCQMFKRAVELTKFDSERGFSDLVQVAWHHTREVGLSTSTDITPLTRAVAHAVHNQDEPGEIFRCVETAYKYWKTLNPK